MRRLEAGGDVPAPRGWAASCLAPGGLLVHGGNSNTNTRLDDMYLLHCP